MSSGMVQVVVRSFFTSDALDINLAPSISILLPAGGDHSRIGDTVKLAIDGFDGLVPSDVLRRLIADGYAGEKYASNDWRVMTEQEVEEFLADEADEKEGK